MRLIRIAGIVLIIGGIAVILLSLAMRISAEKQSSELVEAYLDYARHLTTEQGSEISTEVTTAVQAEATTQAVTVPENMLGVIIIDKIDLKAPLAEGTDNKSIRYALGHFKDTAMPGETGNFAVAGHRSYTFGEYFNRLDELEKGDIIKVIYGGSTYNYEVDESFVVEPEQVEVLESGDKAEITLVTCTPEWTATHRLIVKGHLTEDSNG